MKGYKTKTIRWDEIQVTALPVDYQNYMDNNSM